MAIHFLKRATRTAASGDAEVRETVGRLLGELERGGDETARRLTRELDRWDGEIIVSPEARTAAAALVPAGLRADIRMAHDNVQRFALAQRSAIGDAELEVVPGLVAGHRTIPLDTAGCYVPGGRYAHIASAIMSVTTAKAAGVRHIVACSPPLSPTGIHPATLYALGACGADVILNLGGVPAIAALAFGLFGTRPADIIVGPGNQYVAEAKRALFGRVAIDMFAGPTESAIIADRLTDPEIAAADLVGQAEHGQNSPLWLIALDRSVAERIMELVERDIAALPLPNRTSAAGA
jgi:sulfopropanediol 3-dehydrogenase